MNRLHIVLLVLFTCAVGCIPRAGFAFAEEPTKTTEAPLQTVKVNPKDGVEMVLVPAGEFLMGTSKEQLATCLEDVPAGIDERKFNDELPQHSVYLDAYYIYKTEVTIAQWNRFCKATGRPEAGMMDEVANWADYPMMGVTWEDAAAYAQWAGAGLPTEAQWEKAARGTDGRVYPWGNAWDARKVVKGHRKAAGTLPADTSPYGCLDMAGSVWEWCADWYDPAYYKNAPVRNPTGPEKGATRVMRGGTYSQSLPYLFRTTYRSETFPLSRNYFGIGFRCVVRIPEPVR